MLNLEQVVKICKTLKCAAYLELGRDGDVLGTVRFIGAKREDILRYRRELGLPELRKKYWEQYPDIDWQGEGVFFNHVEVCKVIRCEERVVPAQPEHIEKRLIYGCKNGKVE
jgi:hypothetical protein